jgi:hypothetical protein
MSGIKVFVTANGDVHFVPAHLHSVRITKAGWPHKRDPLYKDYLVWISGLNK